MDIDATVTRLEKDTRLRLTDLRDRIDFVLEETEPVMLASLGYSELMPIWEMVNRNLVELRLYARLQKTMGAAEEDGGDGP